jgi:ribosome-binding factor A
MSQRTERIDELLRQEIGTILSTEAKDPRIGFATVTEVETAPDLRHARVWVSVIGAKSERDETLEALRHAMHYVRRELGTRLHLRRIPELHVRLDDSIERGARLLHLINELEEGHTPPEGELDPELPTPVARIAREGDAAEPADPVGESDERPLPAIPSAPRSGRKPVQRRGSDPRRGSGPRRGSSPRGPRPR